MKKIYLALVLVGTLVLTMGVTDNRARGASNIEGVLICLPHKQEHLIHDKYALASTTLSCGAADGSIVIETNLDTLSENRWRLVQVINDSEGAVYYLQK